MVKLTPAMRKYCELKITWDRRSEPSIHIDEIIRFFPKRFDTDDWDSIEQQLWAVREGLAD